MKKLRFSLRTMLALVTMVAVAWWLTREGIEQKLIVERIVAQGGTAFAAKQVQLASGDSIFHHCRHRLRVVNLTCSSQHPVDQQLAPLFKLRELHCLKLVPQTPTDSGLTEAAAQSLLKKRLKLNWLIVEGATCSNADLRNIRDALTTTKGYLKRHNGAKLTLSSSSVVIKFLNAMQFRDGVDEPSPRLTKR